MEFLAKTRDLWLILHLFAMVLGLGGATYSDILLFRFLKDYKISKKEADVIKVMSRIILAGIVLATISGIALFLPESERLMEASKFQTKMLIFIILAVNGFLLHHLVLPQLEQFTFHKHTMVEGTQFRLRHMSFVMGAISVVSWYSVFILGSLRSISLSFWQASGIYLLLLAVAISIALIVEKQISKQIKKKTSK